MKPEDFLIRQLEIIPLDVLDRQITIIGAGAIGSWVGLALAKMGLSDITIFDPDVFDAENINSQFCRLSDIGRPKVEAVTEMIRDFTGVEIRGLQQLYEGDIVFPGIVISAVDSMKARKSIWNAHKGNPSTDLLIDPRMGAEQAIMFVIDPKNPKSIESYPKSLYSDEEAVQERCTAKATIYTANLLSGLVCKAVKDVLVGKPFYKTVQWDIGGNQFQGFISDN